MGGLVGEIESTRNKQRLEKIRLQIFKEDINAAKSVVSRKYLFKCMMEYIM